MKSIVTAAILTFVATVIAAHASADTAALEADAQKAYDARDFTQAGRASAQSAAELYASLAEQTSEPTKKGEYLVKQAASCFFLGDSAQTDGEKIVQFGAGIAVASSAVKLFGVQDVNKVSDADVQALNKRPKNELLALNEGLYVRGINLGQWGVAKGVLASLDKWPELRATMELVVKLGGKTLHEYGPYRTLGRAYFKIPALLGGDGAKAAKYLQATVQGTLASGQAYSINGFNNLFYAELLKDQGQDAQAKKILQDYLKADPKTILPGYEPETRSAMRQTQDMLKNW